MDEPEFPEPEMEVCCMAMMADCLACSAGINVPRYCRKNPDVDGCDEVYDCMHDRECARPFFEREEREGLPPLCPCYKAKRVSFCFDLPVDHEGLVDDKWRGMESIE
jgi:hypothetical protein